MTDALTVEVGLPGGAVSLPLASSDDELAAWARRTARERLGAQGAEDRVDALAGALRDAAIDSRGRQPITALSFCPDPSAGELARIEVSSLGAPPGAAELTLQDMAAYLGTRGARSTGPAQVSYTDLPVGPAVRVSHQYAVERPAGAGWPDAAGPAGAEATGGAGAFEGAEDEGQGTVVQTLAYAARPPETDRAIVLFVSWQALAFTDRLSALTDKLARTLRMVPVG